MKIYFSRHGESQANVLHEISNRGLKHPLTMAGRQQALDLARRLEERAITHIYTSPVLRAIETTVIVANQLGVDYEVVEALREYDVGHLEGRADEEAWRLWRVLFDDWTQHQRWDRCIAGGETFYAVQERFVPFIDRLVQQYSNTPANLLCVAHGGLYWMMLPAVLTNVDTAFVATHGGFDYTSLVVAEPGPDGLRCIEWNGVSIGSCEFTQHMLRYRSVS
jgi:broad specificity phosphatase PhoE